MKDKLRYKTLIWTLVFYLILSIHNLSWAKQRNLLLYALNTTFLPDIENVLRDLRDYQTNEPIFSKITNLNKWSINRLESGQLDELIRFYESSPELRSKSESAKRADKLFLELIRQTDAYIRIDVLPKLPLLEFQFIITDSLPEVETGNFLMMVTNESRYRGFVIDISREEYHYQLENYLKRLFPNSNRPPIQIVKLNIEKNEDGYYYFGVGRTAILDATQSYDLDTPPEHLRFHWAQKNPNDDHKPVPENEIVPIDGSSKKQVLSFTNKGEYHIALTVSDGIADSKEEIIKIKVIDSPKLLAESYYSLKSKGLLSDCRFRIPFSIILPQGESAKPNIFWVSKTVHRSFLLQAIWGKPDIRTLSPNTYKVNYLSQTINSQSSTKYYEVVVEEEGAIADYQYEFHIAAQSSKLLSDTLQVRVDFQNRQCCFTGDFLNFSFFGHRDTVYTDKRVLAFRLGMRLHVYKETSLDFGKIIPLFEEDVEDSLDIFHTPDSYFSFNYSYLSIPIYLSKGKNGIGCSMDIGRLFGFFPLWIGITHYGHKNYSANVSSGFELSPSWTPPVFLGWWVLGFLSFGL
jgi:hypothetical protein